LRRSIEGTQVRAASFSGGVDSSIVLGFGKQCDNGRWNAVTNYFEGVGDSDERAFAEPVARQLGVPWYPTQLSVDWDWERLAASACQPDALDRAPFIGTSTAKAKDLGSDVVVSGAFGDVVSGAIPVRIPLLIRRHRIAEARSEFERHCGTSFVGRLRFLGQIGVYENVPIIGIAHRMKRLLALRRDPLLNLLSPDVIRKFDLVNRINAFRETWYCRDISSEDLINFYVKTAVQSGLRASRLAGHRVGVPIRHPFLFPGVLSTFASIPQDWQLNAQGDRAIIRQAMTGIVPEAARVRRTKTFYSGYFRKLWHSALIGVVGQVGGPEVTELYRNRDYFNSIRKNDLSTGEVQFSFLLAISGLWLHVARRYR
jgi:asparagine synthetase B (glutamine-hydrolysing)